MSELIRDRGPLSRRRDGVSAQRDNDGPRLHGGATQRGRGGRANGVVPWPRRSFHVRNTVSIPLGGPPVTGSLNSACHENRPPPTFHSRSTPGAVGGCGEPTSPLGSRTVGLGRHANNSGPRGPIAAATSAANARGVPLSNPWAVQTRASPPPSGAGAMTSKGSRGRGVQPAESEDADDTSAAAMRQVWRG